MAFWQKNLKMLEQVDRTLAHETRDLQTTVAAEVFPARNGMLTLRVNGLALHSLYDPVKEAELQVKRFTEEGPERGPILVLGLGLGYHVEKLLAVARSSAVILIEPNMDVFRLSLQKRDMNTVLQGCRHLLVGRGVEDVVGFLDGMTPPRGTWRVFVHGPSMTMNGGYFERVTGRVGAKNVLRRLRLRIVVVSPIYGGSLPIARYCVKALRKLGHRVAMVDNSSYHGLLRETESVTTNSFHRRQLKGSLTQHLAEVVMAKCLDLNPDLVLALAQAPLTPDILERMRKFGILTAFWFVEDFRELAYWRDVGSRYNHFFAIQDRRDFEESETLDGVDFTYLPLACDPSVHRTIQLSDREAKRFGSPVSFVGAGYHNRRIFFEGLLDLDFKIWGTEWDPLAPLARVVQEGGRRVTTREAVKIFNGSTINMNLHSSTYHRGVNPMGDFVNPRAFEIASSGGFQLIDPRSHLPALFEPGREIACFESLADLREKIRHYLSHPEERADIALRGQKRARRDHTFTRRMQGLLETVVERNLSQFQALESQRQTPERLIAEAGAHTALGQFLKRFSGEGCLSLETIVSEIHRGEGRLTEPEMIFLLMHEFAEQKRRRLRELTR